MTIEFIKKTCNNFGFFKDLEELKKIINQDITHCLGYELDELDTSIIHLNSIDEIDEVEQDEMTLLVKLGKELEIEHEVIQEGVLDEFEYLTEEELNRFNVLMSDKEQLSKHQLRQFDLEILEKIYINSQDNQLRYDLLQYLYDKGNYQELTSKYPIQLEKIKTKVIVNNDLFQDIRIHLNKSDKNTSTKNYSYDRADIMRNAQKLLSDTDRYSNKVFDVIHSRKDSGIRSNINHGTLDILTVNGVLKVPDETAHLSLEILMNKLRRFKSFNIYFEHPSLEQKAIASDVPVDILRPEYTINEGELLAVAFSYITRYYFPYMTVVTDENKELSYLI